MAYKGVAVFVIKYGITICGLTPSHNVNILNPIFHKIAWNLAYITKHHGELIYDIMKDFDVSPIGKQFKFDYLCKKNSSKSFESCVCYILRPSRNALKFLFAGVYSDYAERTCHMILH